MKESSSKNGASIDSSLEIIKEIRKVGTYCENKTDKKEALRIILSKDSTGFPLKISIFEVTIKHDDMKHFGYSSWQ